MDSKMLVTELRGWKENPAMSDDARRKCYLMRNAADRIERLEEIVLHINGSICGSEPCPYEVEIGAIIHDAPNMFSK